MNEGQQIDYHALMARGLTWFQAMDYTDMHRLGYSHSTVLDRYAATMKAGESQ